jgi:hypothetical protein
VRWVAAADQLRPGARLLLQAHREQQAQPLLCLQFVGAGKVAMLLTDETHRWARHPDGEQHYARFWLQMIRYLSRAKLLGGNRLIEFTSDKEAYEQGETAHLKIRFFDERAAPAADDGVTAILEHSSGRRRNIRFVRDGTHRGVFQADVSELADGDYRAWLATPVVGGEPPALRFEIIAPRGERARLEMDAADLRLAAERSSGKFYTLQDVERLTRDLPPGRQVRVQTLPPRALWNAPIWTVLFLILITSEWLLRKKAGML